MHSPEFILFEHFYLIQADLLMERNTEDRFLQRVEV